MDPLTELQYSETYRSKIIKQSIYKHLEDNEVTRNSQYAFVKNILSLTNLISFFDRVSALVDKGDVTKMIHLNFSEAFDNISHDSLISKLEKYSLD